MIACCMVLGHNSDMVAFVQHRHSTFLAPLAKANVPLLLVCGSNDRASTTTRVHHRRRILPPNLSLRSQPGRGVHYAAVEMNASNKKACGHCSCDFTSML